MGYSPERKAAVLKRMLPPNNMAIRQLSQEEGISEATLHKWRGQARGNPTDPFGSIPKTKSALLKPETPHEIGGQLL